MTQKEAKDEIIIEIKSTQTSIRKTQNSIGLQLKKRKYIKLSETTVYPDYDAYCMTVKRGSGLNQQPPSPHESLYYSDMLSRNTRAYFVA